MGAKRLEQLNDNLAAIHLKLTQGELRSLDEASQLPPEYPEWMLATQGPDRLDIDRKSVGGEFACSIEAFTFAARSEPQPRFSL